MNFLIGRNIFSVLIFFGLLFLTACEKAVKPVEEEGYTANIALNSVYTAFDTSSNQRYFSDTLPSSSSLNWKEGLAYKINFSINETTDQTVIYNIYKYSEDGKSRELIGRSLGENANFTPNDTLLYKTQRGNVEKIIFDNNNYYYNAVNPNNVSQFKYGVSVIYDVQNNSDTYDLAEGFEGKVTFSEVLGGGRIEDFQINNGEEFTAYDTVNISGSFDTTGLEYIILYRYSEIFSLSLPDNDIINIFSKRDSLGLNQTFELYNSSSAETIKWISNDSVITQYGSLYGLGGRRDTIYLSEMDTYFDSLKFLGDNFIWFSKKDTLLEGIGKKWVVIEGHWKADYDNTKWNPLYDKIDIKTYYAILQLDTANTNIRINNLSKQICVTKDNISFTFNTFNNETFSDSVYVWLATRNLSADFFDDMSGSATITNYKTELYYNDATTMDVYDCILETSPNLFIINQIGKAEGNIDIADNNDYRVSPLYNFNALGKKDITITQIQSPFDRNILARSIKKGSFMGYNENNLNSFSKTQLLKVDMNGRVRKDSTAGWHTVIANDTIKDSLVNQGIDSVYFGEYLKSYDDKSYVLPITNLALNCQSTERGYKEFILIAYTKGRFFKEPRIFISKFYTQYAYVWDKTPPHIYWSEYYDPKTNSQYAPIYYVNSQSTSDTRITNLLEVDNVFSVYLLPNFKTIGNPAGIRDMGFGKIDSIYLCFHLQEDYKTDPITGLRDYSTPIKRYSLPKKEIEKQILSKYTQDYIKSSYSIISTHFDSIDARNWQPGIWDMWIESRDDLGNKGIAPFGDYYGGGVNIDKSKGYFWVRQIQIK